MVTEHPTTPDRENKDQEPLIEGAFASPETLRKIGRFFFVGAIGCLFISAPYTYVLAAATHSLLFAIALVLVLEAMAFGSKVAARYIPQWKILLNLLCLALLSVTTLANILAGWDHLAAAELTGSIAAVRDFVWRGFPLGSTLLVVFFSAIVPFCMWLFLSLWVGLLEMAERSTPLAAARQNIKPLARTVAEIQEANILLTGLMQHKGGGQGGLEGHTLQPSMQYPRVAPPNPQWNYTPYASEGLDQEGTPSHQEGVATVQLDPGVVNQGVDPQLPNPSPESNTLLLDPGVPAAQYIEETETGYRCTLCGKEGATKSVVFGHMNKHKRKRG